MELCGAINFLVILLAQGPVVSFIVQAAKRIPWVAANPLVVVALLNAAAAVTANIVWCGVDFAALIAHFIAGFSASVAAYESVKAVVKS